MMNFYSGDFVKHSKFGLGKVIFFDGVCSDEVVEFHNTLDLNTRRW